MNYVHTYIIIIIFQLKYYYSEKYKTDSYKIVFQKQKKNIEYF